MIMALESSITKSILVYLNSLPNCVAEKVKGDGVSSGRADINACYKGRCIRIEVKTPDNRNRASVKQEHNLAKWNSAGAITMIVYSKRAVEEFIQAIGLISMTIQEANGCVSVMRG
jgi:penicillin-binding protein-related factor A (putative recombinase)